MVSNSIRYRLAAVALAFSALCAVASGCGGSGADSSATPLSLELRLVRAGQLAGWKETEPPETIDDAAPFADQIQDTLIVATPEEVVAELERRGFVAASISSLGRPPNHVPGGSGVVELDSEADARAVQDWTVRDSLSPCPNECTIDISEFDVEGIPDAVGIKRERQPGAVPRFTYYEVSFTDGPFYYVVLAGGDPAHMVTKDDVISSARALWEQVRGKPLPAGDAPAAVANQGG